jgi:hypothetical protein
VWKTQPPREVRGEERHRVMEPSALQTNIGTSAALGWLLGGAVRGGKNKGAWVPHRLGFANPDPMHAVVLFHE